MKTLTSKTAVFATLIASSVMFSSAAKAEQLVSLETAIDMMLSQQSKMVLQEVSNQVAKNIQQELANFNIDSLMNQQGVPTVTIRDIAKLDNKESGANSQTAMLK
ncbi:hypothetical protein [Thalassotalea aquiviva]|uniref:hypothetical protein n=1 Tax=Thalassotalea aquiviva TaxID=3242415 RepID=UPI00352AD765